MPDELKFSRPIENDETPEVETLTVSEEAGRVRICLDSPDLMFTGTYHLSPEEEDALIAYLLEHREARRG